MKLRKWMSVFLAIAMVLSLVTVPAMAEGENEAPYVAQIDQTGYTSLANAFEQGGNITLLSNVTLSGETLTVTTDKTVVLDLAGYTIAGTDTKESGNFELISNKGTLTIKDSDGAGAITLTATTNRAWNNYSAVIANLGGTLTVTGGTIQHLGGTSMAYAIDNNSTLGDTTLTINGGNVLSNKYRAIRHFANSTTYTNTTTVNGGTVKGGSGTLGNNAWSTAIWMQSPNSDANSASLIVKEAAKVGSINVYNSGDASNFSLSVAAAALIQDDPNGVASVLDNVSDEGYVIKNDNGTYIIAKYIAAKIGSTEYKTLAAAIANANAASGAVTIEVLADCTLDSITSVTGNATLNLNGKTVTLTKDGRFDLGSADVNTNVIVTGEGKIMNDDGTNHGYLFVARNGAVLTIKNGTYYAGLTVAQANSNAQINIEDGAFAAWSQYNNKYWVLNLKDDGNGSISVTGGQFTNFDPSNGETENPEKSFVAAGYVAVQNDSVWTVVKNEAKISYNSNGGSAVASETIDLSTKTTFTKPADPTRSGYSFAGWYCDEALTTAYEFTSQPSAGDDMTVYAKWTQVYSGSTSSSSGSSNTTTTTEKNDDGSTTTTTTNKVTGTVTETTKNTDGSSVTVETQKDGTVTETVKESNGTTGTIVTNDDGDVTEVSASVSSSAVKEAAATGEAVTLPVEVAAASTTEEATAVEISVPSSASKSGVKVEIPVEDVTPGTVVVLVAEDGTETIVPTTQMTEDGVAITVTEGVTVKVVDNSKEFTDVSDDHTFADETDFASARGIIEGYADGSFGVANPATSAAVVTVIARTLGEQFYGETATTEAAAWAADQGLTEGLDMTGHVSRETYMILLWRAEGMPIADLSELGDFTDAHTLSDLGRLAMAWAVENGLINGYPNGTIGPDGNISRGAMAAIAQRFIQLG